MSTGIIKIRGKDWTWRIVGNAPLRSNANDTVPVFEIERDGKVHQLGRDMWYGSEDLFVLDAPALSGQCFKDVDGVLYTQHEFRTRKLGHITFMVYGTWGIPGTETLVTNKETGEVVPVLLNFFYVRYANADKATWRKLLTAVKAHIRTFSENTNFSIEGVSRFTFARMPKVPKFEWDGLVLSPVGTKPDHTKVVTALRLKRERLVAEIAALDAQLESLVTP